MEPHANVTITVFFYHHISTLTFTHNVTELQIAYSNGEIITKLSQFVFGFLTMKTGYLLKSGREQALVISVEENNKGAIQTV